MVIRITRAGEIADAKPCQHCAHKMKQIPYLRYVYWSTSDGQIKCERVAHFKADVVATGQIYRANGFKHLQGGTNKCRHTLNRRALKKNQVKNEGQVT